MADISLGIKDISRMEVAGESGHGPNSIAEPNISRLNGSTCLAELQLHREQWLQGLRASASSSLDLHPDMLSPLCQAPEHGLIAFASWQTIDGEREPQGRLAVLAGKQIRLRILPKPAVQIVFRGHRLVGNEIIGCASASQAMPFTLAMVELLAKRESEGVLIENLDIGSALHEAIVNTAKSDGRIVIHWPSKPQPHWWIDFPTQPADYWKKFSKKTRDTIRSKAKKLDHRLLRFTTTGDTTRFLELAEQVSKVSWQTKRMGLRIMNSPDMCRYWERIAGIGAFRSYVLEHQGRPIAFMVGRQWNGKFAYEEAGYDLEFGRYSPGTVLQCRVLEDLIADDPPRLLDFSFGDGEHKRLFGNRQTTSAAILIVRSSLKHSAIFALKRFASGAIEHVRSSNIYRRLRRSYRG